MNKNFCLLATCFVNALAIAVIKQDYCTFSILDAHDPMLNVLYGVIQTPILIVALVFVLLPSAWCEQTQWQHYGSNQAGQRFVNSSIITPKNINQVKLAWTYQTGDIANGDEYGGRESSFKATPILINDKLIFSTGFNRVIALNPTSGELLWRFDPDVDFSKPYAEMFTSRGVSAWTNPEAQPGALCATRIFLGTLDARLISLDAATGKRCDAFGHNGEIDLSKGIKRFRRGEYAVTSPPTIAGNLVITGSSIGDNGSVQLESGVVRAFDARSGDLVWSFAPVQSEPAPSFWQFWKEPVNVVTGAANVWSTMAVDEQAGLVYLPTTSPSPDFYGGLRPGNNQNANSVVALHIKTGQLAWRYQIVRHDLWDYDLAAQPMLMDINTDKGVRPALIQATKMGLLFVLDRHTGEAIFPIREQAVPPSDVPGELAATHQPVSSIALHPAPKTMPNIWAKNAAHVKTCEAMLDGVRFEGMYTPPSLQGTLLYPGNPGGVNWGSMAAHPQQQLAFVAVNRLPTVVKLLPRKQFNQQQRDGKINGVKAQFTEMSGTPYGMARYDLYSDDTGGHCLEGPWSTLVGVNLNSGKVIWESPAGTGPGIDTESEAASWGYFVNGGPLVTAGGVVFLATQYDKLLHAYDMQDGQHIWQSTMPAGAHATPMGYEINGRQYVVITAGGNRSDGKGRGDYVLAYRLARSE